jgi:hypothetical protein
MEIIKKWNKLFLLGIFAIVTTFSSEYVQSSPLDGSAELLDGTAELIKQWDSLNKIIDQARNSHVNNGRVDTTYCYLSGIQTTIAEMLAHQIETSLTYVPNAASYTDGFVSKQWLLIFTI